MDFKSDEQTALQTGRRFHGAKYSIYVMTQLTRIMIYHHNIFGEEGKSDTIKRKRPRL